ncbi:MAG: hypoxanthine phosphoribosyltransferase [Oligoflexales bacterium]|nr:hypoxanthine phosphoribosyltransferase [Oligoflexales bacterium]
MHTDHKILISHSRIEQRLQELGKQITRDYLGKDLVVLGILKGSFVFAADLVRQIALPLEIDFIGVSSYAGTTTTEDCKVTKELHLDINNKNVLIVEDIVDTGYTIKFLMNYLKKYNPSSIEVCTFLHKPAARKAQFILKYQAFEIGNEFVIGYGLDYNEKYRNLADVCILKI